MQELKRYIFGEVSAGRMSVDMASGVLAHADTQAAGAVAVIGMAGRYPQADDIDAYWRNLVDGLDCVTEVPAGRWPLDGFYCEQPDAAKALGKSASKWGGFLKDIEHFDLEFFGIGQEEARYIGPKELLFLEVAWNTLESAGYTRDLIKRSCGGAVGVFVGTAPGTNHYFGIGSERNSPIQAVSIASIANRVSRAFDLNGPSVAVDTQSSSSLTAFHMACESIARGDCRMALAGGITLLYPELFIYMTQFRLLGSHSASRSFSQGDGLLLAEGAGALLLKSLPHAVADGDNILAIVRATAATHAGSLGPAMIPNVAAQTRLLESVIARSGVAPHTIDCVESAANGSPLGDAIEIEALARAFGQHPAREQPVALSSAKSILGHAEAASGMTQLTKAILQLSRATMAPGMAPATVNNAVNLSSTPFFLLQETRHWPQPASHARRALVNSFGAGGSYVSAVLEAYPSPPSAAMAGPEPGPHLVVLSARNMERLTAALHRLGDFLQSNPELDLRDVAYTLQTGREAMSFRWATLVGDREELLHALKLNPSPVHDVALGDSVPPVFLGNTNDHKAELHRWLDERAQQELLERYMDEGDLERVAACWVTGANVPWAGLHEGRPRRRVPLPGYPFHRVCINPMGSTADNVSPQRAERSVA